jgi:Ca2+-transporting ATPase
VCSIVFESEPDEADVMERPPRDPAAPLFSTALITTSLLQGLLVLLATGGFFVIALRAGVAEAAARAATFVALVLCSVALIIVNRAFSGHLWAALRQPNPALWRVVAATLALLAAALLVAPLRDLFRFTLPGADLLLAAAGLALAVLLTLEALQRLQRRQA